MNERQHVGRLLVIAQIKCGVRFIIEDLDELRIKYGHKNINVLTPKVETRLRSGFLPAIPLRLNFILNEPISFNLVYETGFPETSPIKVESWNMQAFDVDISDKILELVTNYCNQINKETGHYPRSLDIIKHLEDTISKLDKISTDGISEIVNVEEIQENTAIIKDPCVRLNTEYKCCSCRKVIFHHSDLQSNHILLSNPNRNAMKCTSYFLNEIPSWIQYNSTEANGKINCPNIKCAAKLGHWSWSGCQCGCQTWITPGFQIIKSKVDMHYAADGNTINKEEM